jgi:hypothetical protein
MRLQDASHWLGHSFEGSWLVTGLEALHKKYPLSGYFLCRIPACARNRVNVQGVLRLAEDADVVAR